MNLAGLDLLSQGSNEQAEDYFRKALEHDLLYVPAHNNLGLILLRRGQLYAAAWEFQTAARLAPDQSEPRANLAVLYEEIGRLDDAIEAYQQALEIDPDNLVAMRHLARACVKAGREDDKLRALLQRLTTHTDGTSWDYWVRGQIIRLGRPAPDRTEPEGL